MKTRNKENFEIKKGVETMKKYFIVEEYYNREKSNVFKYQNSCGSYENEIFNTLEEAREFCKKNKITTYDLFNNEKTLYHYWIEEREVDEDNEIIADDYEHYTVTADEENDTLIYDRNTASYEVVGNTYGYNNIFKVAEKLFTKNLSKDNFYFEYFDVNIDYGTLYLYSEEVMETKNTKAVINKLKEIGVYKDVIEEYIRDIEEVIFKK